MTRGNAIQRGDWTMRGAGSNPKTGNTAKRTGTTRDTGTTQHTPTALQHSHRANKRGDADTERGGHHAQDGESITLPPFNHHATHHHNGTPPSTTAPPTIRDEGGADRGYPTTRTPQTRTHHPHATRLASNSARHDSSTRQHCNGMSRARVTSLHWPGQRQHTTAIPHTEEDGHHPPIHSSTLTHSCSHNQRSTMIN